MEEKQANGREQRGRAEKRREREKRGRRGKSSKRREGKRREGKAKRREEKGTNGSKGGTKRTPSFSYRLLRLLVVHEPNLTLSRFGCSARNSQSPFGISYASWSIWAVDAKSKEATLILPRWFVIHVRIAIMSLSLSAIHQVQNLLRRCDDRLAQISNVTVARLNKNTKILLKYWFMNFYQREFTVSICIFSLFFVGLSRSRISSL